MSANGTFFSQGILGGSYHRYCNGISTGAIQAGAGKIVPKNSPDWTVIPDSSEVVGFTGGVLACRTFTESTVDRGSSYRAGGGVGWQPNLQTVRNYKSSFMITNFPAARKLRKGDILPPLRVMRVSAPVTRSNGLRTTRTQNLSLYDFGVDYVPPPRKLTPAEAEAARVGASKMNDQAEAAKLKFDEEQAENGRDRYQYRMGVRYLKGDGVPADTDRASEYFSKAAAQGNRDAQRELDKLSTSATQPQTNASPVRAGEE